MPYFSNASKEKLDSCQADLIRLFNKVIEHWDCTIIYGHRSMEEQMELFKKGRSFVKGEWRITDKSKVRTYKDGTKEKSYHNYYPSQAVDVAPYPIDWGDETRFIAFGNYVKGVADAMGISVKWGGDWESFKDYAHWYIERSV